MRIEPSQFAVDHAKIHDYLLSAVHPKGRSKAAFFRAFGFSPSAPEGFRAALLRHPVLTAEAGRRPTPTA